MRRLVAERGELGEDHSECISDQQLQPGVVEEDGPRSPHRPRVSKPANSMESAAQAERSWTVLVEDPEDINGSGRGPRIIDRCEAEGVTNTWTYGRSAGAIQIWDGSPSRASTSSGTPPHTESKDSGGG